MLSETIKPITILISLTAVFGLFVHDTKLDNAIVASTTTPAIAASEYTSPARLLTVDQHIHFETNSFSSTSSLNSQQPATQPRNEDEKKYVAARRLMGNNFGNDYSWPSI